MLHTVHSLFYWQILKKTILCSGFKNPYKKFREIRKRESTVYVQFTPGITYEGPGGSLLISLIIICRGIWEYSIAEAVLLLFIWFFIGSYTDYLVFS